MGLSSALSIGRTALSAYQAALNVVGQNIANAGTPGYSRASARLSPLSGPGLSAGQLGSGVRLDAVRRHVSESLNARLRLAGSEQQAALAQRSNLMRMESIFDPLGTFHLGSLMGEFFKSVSNLQNTPEIAASRALVASSAQALTGRIREIHDQLAGLRTELNAQIAEQVTQADQIASRIADLNIRITASEAGSAGSSAALLDERDRLLTDLAEYFAISVREQPNGAVNVYIGSQALVQYGESFGLKVSSEIDAQGMSVAMVRFKLDNGPVLASSGSVKGLIDARDRHVGDQIDRLHTLASSLIREVNLIHASGKGLTGYQSLTGLTRVTDPSLPLAQTGNGIAFLPRTGSFFIDVKDSTTGTVVRTQVHVDLDGIGADSSLNSIAQFINDNVENVNATVLADGRLVLTAADGYDFGFADDTSGFLAAMGINTLFSGTDALNIDVNQLMASQPSLIAAARSGLSGDGSNASAMAALADAAVASLGGVSLTSFYNASMSKLAVDASAARSAHEAGTIIFDSLTVQRESISGVSLDEEAVSMISYQRAYEGAARYMRVVDEMMQVLLGLVR